MHHIITPRVYKPLQSDNTHWSKAKEQKASSSGQKLPILGPGAKNPPQSQLAIIRHISVGTWDGTDTVSPFHKIITTAGKQWLVLSQVLQSQSVSILENQDRKPQPYNATSSPALEDFGITSWHLFLNCFFRHLYLVLR